MKNNELNKKIEEIINNCDFESGLNKFMELEDEYPDEKEFIAGNIDLFIKNNH